MNPSDEHTPNIDHELLDVLVDGELPDAQRRELLASLDRVPGGWRACALAFLEAQCWRQSLAETARGSAPQSELPVAARMRRAAWSRRVGTLAAMAASFLAALAIGWWARTPREATYPEALSSTTFTASQPTMAEFGPAQPASPAGPRMPPGGSSVMTIALPAGWDGGQGEEIRLPVVERERLDHSLLYPDAHSFPPQLREALRKAGYQVRESRELLPVPVQDGRHAIVPVDQLDVHYVGNHVE
jgi:hypothetical protein